jgi:hypothetical protein
LIVVPTAGKRKQLGLGEAGTLRRAGRAMTVREIAQALIADKAVAATRKQLTYRAAIHAALRKPDGVTVVCEGAPARWRLKDAAT